VVSPPGQGSSMDFSRYLYRTGLLLALATISVLCLTQPMGPVVVSNQDKLEHFGAFFVLGWLCYQSLRNRPWWLSWLLVTLYGGLIELFQLLTSYRQGDLADLLADSCGALAAVLLVNALGERRG